MVRVVKVKLELDRTDYKQGLRDAAREMRGFDAEVKTLGRDMERTGVEVKDTGTSARKLGDDAKKSSRDVTDLRRSLDDAKKSLRDLGTEYQKTGKVELDRYRSLTGELRKLERAKKDLEKLTPGGDSKSSLFQSITGGITGGVESALMAAGNAAKQHPYIAAGIAAGILLGAPTIAGALTAAVGAGGIAAGILLAAHDPKVSLAWGAVGRQAMTSLTDAASPFVGVLERGATTFGASLDRILPSIRRDFAELAPVADRLFTGAAGFVERLMPGIDALTRASGPVLDMLSRELPRLGAAISTAFQSIASAGQGGQMALQDMLRMAEGSIVVFGKLLEISERIYLAQRAVFQDFAAAFSNRDFSGAINSMAAALTTTKDAAVQVGPAVQQALQAIQDAIVPAGAAASLTSGQFQALSQQINATAQTADTLASMMVDKLLGSMLSLDQATLGFAQAQTQLSDTLKQNGLQLDIHTAKGEQNRAAILGAVQANIAEYDAMIRSKASASEASAAYDANTRSLEAQMRQAGFTQAQIDGLIGKYRGVPDRVNTDIQTQGLTNAITNLDTLLRQLNGLPTTRTISINEVTYHYDAGPQAGSISGFYHGLARGGVVSYASGGVHDYKMSMRTDYVARSGILKPSNPGTILAGEPSTGGEVFGPRLGISHERGLMLANTLASWHGGTVVRNGMAAGGTRTIVHEHHVTVAYPDGRKIGELLINDAQHGGTAFNSYVRRVAGR